MELDPIESAIAEADLQFARAASDGNWKDWTDLKSEPPWFSEGVKWIWTVLQAHAEFWQSLTVTDHLDKSREVLTRLANGVFDRLLADHQKRKFGQTGLQPREHFANLVSSELLPRIAVRFLSAAVTAQSPARSGPEPAPEAGSRAVAPVLDGGSEGPSPVVAGDNAPAAVPATDAETDAETDAPTANGFPRGGRGRPRLTPNLHPEVEQYLKRVGDAARREITISDFCLVSGFRDDTVFGAWRRGDERRCNFGQAQRFQTTLTLSPEEFLRRLGERPPGNKISP